MTGINQSQPRPRSRGWKQPAAGSVPMPARWPESVSIACNSPPTLLQLGPLCSHSPRLLGLPGEWRGNLGRASQSPSRRHKVQQRFSGGAGDQGHPQRPLPTAPAPPSHQPSSLLPPAAEPPRGQCAPAPPGLGTCCSLYQGERPPPAPNYRLTPQNSAQGTHPCESPLSDPP